MRSQIPIRVTVLDDSRGEHCPAQCGAELFSADSLQFITERLKHRYGERIVLEYLDLAESPASNRDLISRIKEHNLSLPLVAVNGVPRCSGGIDYRTIVEAIETLEEVGSE